MGRMWWLLFNALTVSLINAAPRELSTDELITEPRPGEEYVNIQTSSQDKVDLVGNSFTTSHRIPELLKTNRSRDFQTSHKVPVELERAGRSLSKSDLKSSESEYYNTAESNRRVVFTVSEGTTNEPPLERVVTRTSVKMSKSKKVQKSIIKLPHDELVNIKADEGLIDERPYVDEEEREIMKKKFSKTEFTSDFSTPTRFNVPFEDEEKVISLDAAHLIIPNPVIATTQEPPITTFNYKNVYDKTRKTKGFVSNNVENSEKVQDKYKYETVGSESIKTAESKSITSKKDSKQEKKEKFSGKEEEDPGFYLLPVNKQQMKFKEDNYDFVDLEEKVLVPAGSSPSQSSRINIKKGPNGQEYEYEYVYYYYDDDDESHGGGNAPKEGKVIPSTTEKVYNGHDGPSKEDQEQNAVHGKSSENNKYQTTESTKLPAKAKTRTQAEVVEEIEEEVPAQNLIPKTFRGGNSRFSPSGRQAEPTNNEVYPSSSRLQTRSRGRGSNTPPAVEEEIPSIGEERLPANTRFPPRARANNNPSTSPQPQDTTARTRAREGSNQNRLRIPSLGLLDSSSFRTHASDASVEDDASIRDAELQRKANAKGQTTDASFRRGTRPTTSDEIEAQEPPVVTRRPTIRKPAEDRRPRPVVEEQQQQQIDDSRIPTTLQERPLKVPHEETEKRPRVPIEEEEKEEEEEEEKSSKVPTEELRRPQGPQEEQHQRESVGENTEDKRQQTQTTRESDAEEGIFETAKMVDASAKTVNDQNGSSEIRTNGVTTEDPSAVGLTSAMMEKVALDLYAILQQAQNENIRTNFIDGNSTDMTTDLGEGQTEFSTDDDGSTAEPSTTTTTTTTTTTPSTTTTTTTTTPVPTPGIGRGRYRGRVANGNKSRTKTSTTTTTEAPEITSSRTRGRFQPNNGGIRNSGLSFSRKPTKAPTRESTPDEVPVNEEVSRSPPERTFGERPRNRFRASGKVTTGAPLSSTSPAPTNGAAAVGNRGASADRFHSRRRGGSRTSPPATQHSVAETPVEEERQEIHQESALAEEATPSSPLRSTRPRIGGSIRPLRPGPRAPLLLPQRGHAAATSTTQSPEEHDEIEKEVADTEAQAQQPNEEINEQVTPGGDALTRLKSRPRLRIGGNANQKLQTPPPPPPPQNRRKLVSSLLPKRKPGEEKQMEKIEETEDRIVPVEEISIEEDLAPAVAEPSSTTAEPEVKGLSGLLAGRRRNLNRRPGTIYSRAQPAEA